jgi:hypothetical protein
MSWFGLARRGAAYEFGRRLWRWFLAFEIIGWFARRVLPVLLILAALAVAVWVAIRTSFWWLPRLTLLAVLAVVLTAVVWLARRYRWELRAAMPRLAVAAAVVGLAGAVCSAIWWLR